MLVVTQEMYRGGDEGARFRSEDQPVTLQPRVVDPHTLYLNPDLKFWPNMGPDPETRVLLSTLNERI